MKKIVGFDIGEDSVKLAYFVDGEIKKTVSAEMPDAMVSGGRILSMDAMADFLRDTAKANGIPLTNAAVMLPSSEVFIRAVTMPAMTEKQLYYNLPYEFHDFLTEEKSKYFFDYSMRWVQVDEEDHPESMELLACAILKTKVEEYRAMLRRAGFKLKVLTPAECAYGALLAETETAEAKDRCIVNLDRSSAHLYIYHEDEFDSRREIEVGLDILDERIAEQYGVDIHVAREYRHSNYEGVLQKEYAQEFYHQLMIEVVKAVNFYNYNNRDRELHDVFFCGCVGEIAPMLLAAAEKTKLHICGAEALLEGTQEAWLYFGAAGCVYEGMRGGL